MKKYFFLVICFVSLSTNVWAWSAYLNMRHCDLGVDCVFYPESMFSMFHSDNMPDGIIMGSPLQTGKYTCHIVQKSSKANINLCIGTYAGMAHWRNKECFDLQQNSVGQDVNRSFPFFTDDGYFEFRAMGTSWFSGIGRQAKITVNCRRIGDLADHHINANAGIE